MEALAQEHFNYIAEGDNPSGQPLFGPLSLSRRRWRNISWREWLRWSPRAAMSVATLLLTMVLARHMKEVLVDFMQEVFSPETDNRVMKTSIPVEVGVLRR